MSALGAALHSIGIPKNSIVLYESAIRADKYLVVAHGPANETDKAKTILHATKSSHVADHKLDSPAVPAGIK